MTERDELLRTLEEIRDLQREHLAEYRRVTERSLALQAAANDAQAVVARIYKIVAVAGGVLVVGIVGLIFYLMTLLASYV